MKKIFLLMIFFQMLLLSAQDIWSNGKGPAIVPMGMPASAMPVKDGAITLPSGKYVYTRNIPARLSCAQFKVLELEMRASIQIFFRLNIMRNIWTVMICLNRSIKSFSL